MVANVVIVVVGNGVVDNRVLDIFAGNVYGDEDEKQMD
jgi:hypothetical protein